MSVITSTRPAAVPGAPTRPPGRRFSPATAASYLVGVIIIVVTAVPLLFVVINGFRTNAEINNSATGLPHPWVLAYYKELLTSGLFWRYILNSAIIASVVTLLTVALGSMAGFALSRYTFPFREGFFLLFAMGLLLPANVEALPLYLLLQRIGLLDNPIGLALPQAAFSLPFTIVILRPFMRAIPGELEDAAVVDGASRFKFFMRILMPLSRPALVTVSIFTFVTSWNAYLLPFLVFTTQTKFTLPLGVATYQSEFSQDVARICAFTALSTVPALFVFVLAQRRIVGGLAGAVKG